MALWLRATRPGTSTRNAQPAEAAVGRGVEDARFDDFRERVLAYPLPPKTESKGSDATFDKIRGGNGDYCEYRVQLVLQTGLSQGEIRTYYDEARISGADDEEHALVSLSFGDDTGDDMEVTVEFGDLSPDDGDLRCG